MSVGSRDDGGAAFPCQWIDTDSCGEQRVRESHSGMTLRDYFASHCQADDRLVKVVRAMDDTALELFALHPDAERDNWITDVDPTNWLAFLEARAIARVRYMQADAMIAERAK